MLTFINERNCITSKNWGLAVKNHVGDYVVQSPTCNRKEEYDIHSVLIPEESEFVAAFYAILKVSYKI